MKTEQYVTIETESWGWVACPLRWVKKPGDEPNTFSSLEGYKRDCDPDYSDHLLTPGCVDLSSMDSIHALAEVANDLWDDGILNDLVVEAFNPALALKSSVVIRVDISGCEDELDRLWVHASIDDGESTTDVYPADFDAHEILPGVCRPATRSGWECVKSDARAIEKQLADRHPGAMTMVRVSGVAEDIFDAIKGGAA